MSPYTEVTIPTDGVNVFVRFTGENSENFTVPYLYAWNGSQQLLGGFPGRQFTEENLVYVNVIDSDTKVPFYMYHFDAASLSSGSLGVIVSKDQWNQSQNLYITHEGNYFYEAPYYNLKQTTDISNTYLTGGEPIVPTNGTNIFVREQTNWNEFNDDANIYLYAWNGLDHPNGDFPGSVMTNFVVINGQKWFYWHNDATSFEGVVFSNGGGNTQTDNISNVSGNKFYYYQSFNTIWTGKKGYVEQQDLSANLPLKNRTANFKVWTYNETANKKEIVMLSDDGKFRLTFSYYNGVSLQDITFNKETGRLEVPKNTIIKVESLSGYCLNEVILGPVDNSIDGGSGDANFTNPQEDYNIRDWKQATEARSNPEYYYLSNFFATAVNSKTELAVDCKNSTSFDNGSLYIGPTIYVRDERITTEGLTFADHNMRLMTHYIDDEVVGVAVKNVEGKNFLIVRSANQLSSENRQTMRAGQESFKDENGNVYPWSDPNTPQYAWMMVEIDNPDSYVGKKFTGLRGKYCEFSEELYHVYWLNPYMKVQSADVNKIQITGAETTVLNKYPLANLVQPKDDHYFLLKPVLCELCDVLDGMRSHGDHYVYVPDENAIMPEVTVTDENGNEQVVAQSNFYVDNDLSYGKNYSYASFLDNTGKKAYEESDAVILGPNNGADWQLYDKIYDFPSSLIVAAHHAADNQTNGPDLSEYVYPLPLPDSYYTESVNEKVINIVGEGKLKTYNTDFFVGSEDYWSRYKYDENRNAYRNDISFTYSRPVTSNTNQQAFTLKINRCDDKGNVLAQIAEIKNDIYDAKRFFVTSTDAAKEAKDDPALQNIGPEPFFPNGGGNGLMIGEQDANGDWVTRIFLTDMFYSTTMDNAAQNNNLSSDYQYQIEASVDGLTSVVGYAPVYKTNTNVATRANYTKAEVDADLDNTLKENNKAKINFTPNMAKAMTEYRVYKGDATQGENFANIASSAIVLNNNFLDQAIEDEEIVDGTVYVPELYTEYNHNTYGCYKQSVSDASVEMNVKSIVAADFTNDENGTRYIHAAIDLSSVINNTDKDSRYLLRVWRQVGNSEKVLLNDQEEAWETNYKALRYLGMDEDKFSKTNPSQPFTLYDTFEASTTTNAAHGLKAEGETVNIEDVTYYATLYVKDDASGKYYVKQSEGLKLNTTIPTAISTIAGSAQVESVRYINVAGMESDKPFAGMNIVVTRYSNGTTTITKMIK